MSSPYPPASARSRSVLVRNIPRLADDAALDEFFSFCGTIESKRMCLVPAHVTPAGAEPTQEAVVVFADEASRRTALLMNESSILDAPVSITPVPDAYIPPDELPPQSQYDDANADRNLQSAEQADMQSDGGAFGGLFAGFGGLLTGVGTTLSAEYQKAATMFDTATETGALKTAKDQAALAKRKTAELIQNVDEQYQVQQRAGAVAGVVSTQTRNVASAVAEQSKSLAIQVDSTLHISEHTRNIQQRAMANETVNSGIRTFRLGIDSLLTQTGLQNSANGQPAVAPAANPSNSNSNPSNAPTTATG